ncbi:MULTISPECIES: putative zinc-binding protein [Halomonas]|uniref:DGC domain protein n=1 Tax=Halomonas chromatireducens TaxID=507626 RepID=A0A0X8HDT5_9GAMM|nr:MULTISPECIES: putative zinc-binding protein [Halomonas]AMD00808.1 DGC domain protein [Halomonas chromatireducens]MBZ0330875.1 putative zinc-binding protein [Halomonas sp. ANAO-440]
MSRTANKPRTLVYSCSGCSDVAQLANDVALALDHTGVAEMSCIAGVGGGVPGLVKTARSGRPIIAIDGCQMHCVTHCLANAGVSATEHVKLYEQGFRKRRGQTYSEEEVTAVAERVGSLIARLPVDAVAHIETSAEKKTEESP